MCSFYFPKHFPLPVLIHLRSPDSSIGIAMGCGLGCLSSTPGRGKISLLATTSKPALGPPSHLFSGYRGEEALSPEVTAAEA
jgi:hypothetical protein